MAWAKTDDGAENNPRVVRLEEGEFMLKALNFGDPYLQRGVVWGHLTLLASWSGRHFTDLHFPEFMVRRVAGPAHAAWVVACAQHAGLLSKKKVKGRDGDMGWQFVDNGDELINVLTKEQVEANKNRYSRNGMEVAARLRDGDQCRYCGKAVRFAARNGWMRGTYLEGHREHPDPADRETIVVACGECNQEKGAQTPEEWGRPLRPVPLEPLYNKDTLDLFHRHGITDLAGERERVLAWLGAGSSAGTRTEPGPALAPDQGVQVLSAPGSGRGGAGPGRAGPARDGQPVRAERDSAGPDKPRAVVPLHPRHDDDEGPGAA